MQFGIGQLPEQEIAEPLLTTGADQQIWIGLARGVQLGREGALINSLRVQFPTLNLKSQSAGRLHQLLAAAVVGADIEMNAGVGC